MLKYVFIILCAFYLVACSSSSSSKNYTIDDFHANGNNFELDKSHRYQKVTFDLPESFTDYYSKNTTIGNNSRTYTQYQLGIVFTVEKFTENDIYRPFVRYEETRTNLADLFHSGYVSARARSIDKSEVSIKKTIETKHKLKGILQYVSETLNESQNTKKVYATATFQVKKDFYVFQWIIDNELMAYTMDDFMSVLNTVKSTK
jgi:hypothetical protein